MRCTPIWPYILIVLLTGCASGSYRSELAPVEEALHSPASQNRSINKPPPQMKEGATAAPDTQLVEQNSDTQVFALSEPAPVETRMVSAIDKLTDEAEQHQRSGDLKNAATTLERALRIAPRNPHLWNRLAQIRMQQKLYRQAGDLAQRSNSLTEKGAAIRHGNWRIIAEVRRIEGDFAGAKKADQRATTLQ